MGFRKSGDDDNDVSMLAVELPNTIDAIPVDTSVPSAYEKTAHTMVNNQKGNTLYSSRFEIPNSFQVPPGSNMMAGRM